MKKKFLNALLLLVGAVLLPIILHYGTALFKLYLAFEHPNLTYKGSKAVPEADIIHYGRITLMDLRLDECTTYDNDTLF